MSNSVLKTATRKGDSKLSENEVSVGARGTTEIATGRVVHCKREAYDVLIDRSTKWGNSFVMGRDGDRETVIRKYRAMLESTSAKAQYLRGCLPELRGKVLGCWCAPQPCHGDVLLKMANECEVDVE